MIGQNVHLSAGTGGQYVADPFEIVEAERAADHLRLRIRLPDRRRGEIDQFAVFGAADAVFPAPLAVWLVPHFVTGDLSPVPAHQGGNVTLPRPLLLFAPDRRTADGAEHLRRFLVVERIAVAETDPRLQAATKQIPDDVVEPGEIVDAGLFLRPRPAGLDANPFDAEGGDLVVRLFRVEHGAIELLKPEPEGGLLHLRGVHRFDGTDFCETIHDKLPPIRLCW